MKEALSILILAYLIAVPARGLLLAFGLATVACSPLCAALLVAGWAITAGLVAYVRLAP